MYIKYFFQFQIFKFNSDLIAIFKSFCKSIASYIEVSGDEVFH